MRKERAAGMIAAGKKQDEIAKKLVRRHHGHGEGVAGRPKSAADTRSRAEREKASEPSER